MHPIWFTCRGVLRPTTASEEEGFHQLVATGIHSHLGSWPSPCFLLIGGSSAGDQSEVTSLSQDLNRKPLGGTVSDPSGRDTGPLPSPPTFLPDL